MLVLLVLLQLPVQQLLLLLVLHGNTLVHTTLLSRSGLPACRFHTSGDMLLPASAGGRMSVI